MSDSTLRDPTFAEVLVEYLKRRRNLLTKVDAKYLLPENSKISSINLNDRVLILGPSTFCQVDDSIFYILCVIYIRNEIEFLMHRH